MPKRKTLKSVVGQLKPSKKIEPLWKGPEVDGITQSMISLKLCCSERFRVATIEGLRSPESFQKAIEYGSMWHLCEEELAAGEVTFESLKKYAKTLVRKFPMDVEEIMKWYNVCLVQFPVYAEYWKKHPDVKNRKPAFQEAVFKVPYRLQSGRVVYLKGKFDSVDLIKTDKGWGVWLQENKTKGDINEAFLQKQLTFDLQTMFYLVALETLFQEEIDDWDEDVCLPDAQLIGNVPVPKGAKYPLPIHGVRYNVVRRPLSGGKGSIRRHKATKNKPEETEEEFYSRLRDEYIANEPEYWFMRWNVPVTKTDLDKFKEDFLDPFLENLCWWYDRQVGKSLLPTDFDLNCLHWRLPYGIYNPIAEGYPTDIDEYLASGSTVGLERASTLFPELETEENE